MDEFLFRETYSEHIQTLDEVSQTLTTAGVLLRGVMYGS